MNRTKSTETKAWFRRPLCHWPGDGMGLFYSSQGLLGVIATSHYVQPQTMTVANEIMWKKAYKMEHTMTISQL